MDEIKLSPKPLTLNKHESRDARLQILQQELDTVFRKMAIKISSIYLEEQRQLQDEDLLHFYDRLDGIQREIEQLTLDSSSSDTEDAAMFRRRGSADISTDFSPTSRPLKHSSAATSTDIPSYRVPNSQTPGFASRPRAAASAATTPRSSYFSPPSCQTLKLKVRPYPEQNTRTASMTQTNTMPSSSAPTQTTLSIYTVDDLRQQVKHVRENASATLTSSVPSVSVAEDQEEDSKKTTAIPIKITPKRRF